MLRTLSALIVLTGSATRLDAQVSWQLALDGFVGPREHHGMAYDAARAAIVVHGGTSFAIATHDTWSWDGGTTWHELPVQSTGVLLSRHALAFDATRGKVVLFGGEQFGVFLPETWELDASGWQRRATNGQPAGRADHAMAFDAVRGHTLLFGGIYNGVPRSETWTWDGTSWIQLNPTTVPPARSDHALAWDAARRRVVMFGGYDRGARLGDTWEWDGNDWQSRSPSQSPSARFGHAMAGDPARRRVVLFGGMAGVAQGDTWEWDGNTWVARNPASQPPPSVQHTIAHDPLRRRTVLLTGAETWEWDGNDWSRAVLAARPTSRENAAMTFDPTGGRALLCGGSQTNPRRRLRDLWSWDGVAWTHGRPMPNGTRDAHAIVFDTRRNRVVLFGGRTDPGGAVSADTLEFASGSWIVRTPRTLPPARADHGLAFDDERGEVVLFGGVDAGGAPLGDTWIWDGNDWTRRRPANSPAPRHGSAMTYDRARGVVVLFGGGQTLRDTWEWDGSDWHARTPSTSPPALLGTPTLVYDARRARTVLPGDARIGTWEWDGSNWLRRQPTGDAGIRLDPTAAYDGDRGRVVLFGGLGPSSRGRGDTWTYGPDTAAQWLRGGPGCHATASAPMLDVAEGGLPWIDGWFAVDFTGLTSRAGAAAVHVGLSISIWNGLSLPIDLTGIGMPGCLLWVGPDAIVSAPRLGNDARAGFPIPNRPSLLGQRFFVQGLVLDPSANALGIALTNAGSAVMGGR